MKRISLLFCLIISAITASAQTDCPRIFAKGDTLYTDPAPRYQWFRDQNPIPGATNQWYLPPTKGNFAVEIYGTTENFAFTPQTNEKTITGRIIDERYEPIADATITVGKVSVKSDAKGWFSLKNLTISGENAVVTITKAGFWKNVQRVHFFDQSEAPLTAMLEPLKVTNRFDATKGATISERGFFLTLPPNAVINESGQTYQGTVHLSLKRSFPSEDGFGLRMPGGDFSAIDQNGQEKILVSYGFMSAEMQTPSGEQLRLASNQEATLEFYIPWQENKTAPDSMPLWHFDETAGTWRPEGIARKVGPRYVGTVKHFSSWNCDYPRNRATIKGKTRNCKGYPIPNVVINVGQRIVTSNTNGEYTSFVPSDTEFDVTASVDSITVNPLVEAEEREVKDLEGSAVLDAVGVIDTVGILTVYGLGVKEYSADSGKTFHPKREKLTLTNDYPKEGVARDSFGCAMKFRIFMIPKQGDCQLLGKSGLSQEPKFRSMEEALASDRAVYNLSLVGWGDLSFVIPAFPCLHYLGVSQSQLTSVPESIEHLSNLQTLELRENQLTSFPESIGQLTNLQDLDLRSNQLTSLPESIGQLSNLFSLDLLSNQINYLPESFGSLTRLEILYLDNNSLSNLPVTFGKLTNLQAVYFQSNQLKSLPESIGQLTNLQILGLAYNQLTSLPESIGQLTKLQWLGLANNQLKSLPESIGQLTNLQILGLVNNQLTSLPESIGQLTKLQSLHLGSSQLTALPESIANLKDNLSTLNLSGNPIPEEEKARIRSWLPNTTITF